MDRNSSAPEMTVGRRILLQIVAEHIELLKTSHPRKAASRTARKAERYIEQSLRADPRKRAA
jgi:hypothetical protein